MFRSLYCLLDICVFVAFDRDSMKKLRLYVFLALATVAGVLLYNFAQQVTVGSIAPTAPRPLQPAELRIPAMC